MTGLNPKLDKIIEIGAVKVIDGKAVDNFSSFVNPGRKLSENVIEITGIKDEDLSDAPVAKDVIPDLLDFIGDYPLVGHRIRHDFSFVKHAAVNLGLSFDKEGVDTLKLSRLCHPDLAKKRLGDMCEYYGIELKAHRALNDAEATAKLYERLKESFREKYPKDFEPVKLVYDVKRESPIRPQQKELLISYLSRKGIECPYDINMMTRNEATRYYDKLCSEYGK